MTDEPRYLINSNDGGESVLHRNPREECNLDDAEGVTSIDPTTGTALEASGDILLCQHCANRKEN